MNKQEAYALIRDGLDPQATSRDRTEARRALYWLETRADQPAPTETGPRDYSNDPRLAEALAHPPGPRHARLVEPQGAHVDPIESGRPGKVAITNAPRGAPRIVQSVLSDCHYCDKRELDDDWKCPHCDQHYTINRVELVAREVVK